MAGNVNLSLISAAGSGSLKGVRAALKAGADVNLSIGQLLKLAPGRGTALWNAARGGHIDVVKLLLRKGASLVRRAMVNDSGYSPLHEAADKGHTEIVEILVHHGATLDIQDTLDMTPLMQACMEGHVDTVRQLVGFGARVDLLFDHEIFTGHWYNMLEDKWSGDKEVECFELVWDARDTRLLRCCNPKCNKPGYRSELKLCAACKYTRYCSRECQRQHWIIGHKKCCGLDEFPGPN